MLINPLIFEFWNIFFIIISRLEYLKPHHIYPIGRNLIINGMYHLKLVIIDNMKMEGDISSVEIMD